LDSGGIDAPVSLQPQVDPLLPAKLDDALAFLDQVKACHSDRMEVYGSFLDILKDFNNGILDTPGTIDRMSHLFLDEHELLAGFKNFLPPGWGLEVSHSTGRCVTRMSTPTDTEHEIVVSVDCSKLAKSTLKRKSPSQVDSADNQATPYSSRTQPTKRLRTSLRTSSRPKRPTSSVARRAPKRARKKKAI